MENEDAYYEEWKHVFEIPMRLKGTKQFWNYYLSILNTGSFTRALSTIRKQFNIPANGYISEEDHFVFPKDWDVNTIKKFEAKLLKLCKKFGFHYIGWEDTLKYYIFHNKIIDAFCAFECSMFLISDVAADKKEPFSKLVQSEDDRCFPIALRISPYASQRNIIDFIKKSYKDMIEPLQGKYIKDSNKIGKIRTKKQAIQKRNDFIHEHQKKPRMTIMKLVSKEFNEVLDVGHISKIISLELKKRSENK